LYLQSRNVNHSFIVPSLFPWTMTHAKHSSPKLKQEIHILTRFMAFLASPTRMLFKAFLP